MSEPTGPRLRLRFVYRNVLMPVGLSPADVVSSSGTFLKAHVCHKLEEIFPGQKFDAENMTLLYNEKPLRDVNGSALNGVQDMALIDCIISHAGEAAAASKRAAKAEAQLLENIDNINTSVDDLERQADGGAFIGKDKQLLEALERQLFRLDGMRAAGGQKLSAQVMGARKASTRRINDLHSRIERQAPLAQVNRQSLPPKQATLAASPLQDGGGPVTEATPPFKSLKIK